MLHPLREDEPGQLAHTRSADLAPTRMDHTVGGRKSSQYTPRMARIILARVESGQTVKEVAADPDMPSYRTLYDWIRDNPDFGAAWDQMRRDIAHFRREKIERREQGARRWEEIRARHEGRKARRKTGRRSTWTPARGEAFCDLIGEGLSTREACARPGQPNVQMVHRWLRNHPEFRELYRAAAWAREHRLEDEALVLAESATEANWRLLKSRVERLQRKVGWVRPDVWRWD